MSVNRRIAGRYRLVERVGTGGMGVLWAAHDDSAEQSVAVRILQRGVDEPGRVAHFRSSARAAARLDHPGIVRVLDEGHDPEVGPFIVSAWVDGWPLSAWQGVPLPFTFWRSIGVQLCAALAHIHARGLVHLDLRPGNLLVELTETGPRLVVVDVGCARIDDGWSDQAVGAQATLKLLGSLKYMAPEVGEAPPWLHGPWSDLYSAGLILWELLAGGLPHGDLQGVALLMRRSAEPAPTLPPGVGGVHNATLRNLFLRLLATNPAERPLSAAQIRKTLESLAPPPDEPTVVVPVRGPRVRQSPFDESRARANAYPLLPLRAGPLVGREAESRAVRERVQGVVAGSGSHLVLVEGVLGIGKSRLVQDVLESSEERGLSRTWRVNFAAGSAPGSGLVGALEDLLRAGSTHVEGVARRVAALPLLLGVEPEGLSTILPALLRPDPTPFARPGNEADPGAEVGHVGSAHMVAGAFLELLRRAAGNDAIALFLDDLHLATPAEGVDLVQRILGETGLAVCVVATIASGSPLIETLRTTLPPERATFLELAPLNETDVHNYLVARLGLPDPDHSKVAAAMQGQPLFMRLLSDHLLDDGLMWLDGYVRLRPGKVLPLDPAEVFAAQFDNLGGPGPDALVPDIVQGLAYARLPLTPRVVQALVDSDPHRPWDRALAAAERTRLLWRGPGGRFMFTASVLREWLVSRGRDRAPSWHRRWLKALTQLEEGGRGRLGLERAAHAEALGETAAALAALTEAASWALGPGQQALERAILAAQRAEQLARAIDDTVQTARACRLRGELLRQIGQPEAALSALKNALALLQSQADPVEHGWCLVAMAWLALDARDLPSADRGFGAALSCFTEAGDPGGEAWGNLGRALVCAEMGAHSMARTLARDCEERFATLNAARGVLAARLVRARAADAAGDFATADKRYLRLQETADSRRWLLEATMLRLHRARLALETGRPQDALGLLDAARSLAEPLRLMRLREWIDMVRPGALAATGDATAARYALKLAVLPNPRLRRTAAAALSAAARHPAAQLDEPLAAALERWVERLLAPDPPPAKPEATEAPDLDDDEATAVFGPGGGLVGC